MGNICAESQWKFDIVCLGKPKTVSVEYSCPDTFVGINPFKMCQKRYAVKVVPFHY